MGLRGKKLGLLISAGPGQPGFRHGIGLAEAAVAKGIDVYLYCIDDAVTGLNDARLQSLKNQGLKLFACAYGAQRRQLPIDDRAIFSGLTVVSDLMSATDRFLSFN